LVEPLLARFFRELLNEPVMKDFIVVSAPSVLHGN